MSRDLSAEGQTELSQADRLCVLLNEGNRLLWNAKSGFGWDASQKRLMMHLRRLRLRLRLRR
jgi:hypothetical protein